MLYLLFYFLFFGIGRTVLIDVTAEFVLTNTGIILEATRNLGKGQDAVPLSTLADGPRLCWVP